MSDHREDRLVGWKAIADYLARDERTVQRWTKERRLPVHRLPGGKGASVFAVRAEVEQWLANAPHIAVATQVSPGLPYDPDLISPARPQSDSPPKRTSRGVVLTLAASVTLAALAIGGVVTSRTSSPIPESVDIVGDDIVAKADERVLWRYDLGRPSDAPLDARWRPIRESAIRLIDLNGDGVSEILAPLILSRGDGGLVESRVLTLTAEGKVVWSYTPTTQFTYAEKTFDGPWRLEDWVTSSGANGTRVWMAFIHQIWWPSFVVAVDLRGRATIQFVHPGHIYSLALLRSEGRSYLAAGGVSNDHRGATLAILDIDGQPAAPPSERSPFRCTGCPTEGPFRYLVFPRSELNILLEKPYNRIYQVLPVDAGADLSVEEGADPRYRSVYRLSLGFAPTTVAFSDVFWEAHSRLERDGKIDHPAHACPNRRDGMKVRLWEHSRGWREMSVAYGEGAR